jgi:hypothetical protein
MDFNIKSEKQILIQKEKKLDFENFVNGLFRTESFKTKALKREIGQAAKNVAGYQSYPDLLVRFTENEKSIMFAVKCKWSPKLLPSQSWKSPGKIQKLLLFEVETQMPMFVVLGFGGTPTNPEQIFLAPLKKLENCMVKLSYLLNFKRQTPEKEFVFDPDRMVLK